MKESLGRNESQNKKVYGSPSLIEIGSISEVTKGDVGPYEDAGGTTETTVDFSNT